MSEPAREQQWAPDYQAAPNVTLDAPAYAASEDPAESALRARDADDSIPLPEGVPHVAVQFSGARCLLPLAELRGVLTQSPTLVRFPFGPSWLLGIFLHRAELLALVDPLPVLFGRTRHVADNTIPRSRPPREAPFSAPPDGDQPAILVGSGERTIGFRVGGVSEVVFLTDAHGVRSTALPSELPDPIEARYIAALWAPDEESRALPILAIAPLLDDLLGLLAEEGHDG